MSGYFSNLIENLKELSPATWIILAIGIAVAVVVLVLAKKSEKSKWVLVVSAVGIVVMTILIALSLPQILPESPEDGGLTASGQFLYSPWFWTIILSCIAVVLLVLLLRNQKMTSRMLATGALCIAVSFVLSCITVYKLPNGGSITPASMLPIMLFAYLYGPVPGIAAGIIHGTLQLIQGAYVIHPFQFLLDYIFPFALLGLCGLFCKNEKQFFIGIAVAAVARFIAHFLSGYLFFYMYAPEGQTPFVYSLLYNGSYMLPELIICEVVAWVPQFRKMVRQLKVKATAET
ncbi:MAG: energy-coupled thiamine transporter ThiT [Eubacteriales bacterium]|nr:energy-coupled thiamine transporter ThiT [Eubacteriales bacterium]